MSKIRGEVAALVVFAIIVLAVIGNVIMVNSADYRIFNVLRRFGWFVFAIFGPAVLYSISKMNRWVVLAFAIISLLACFLNMMYAVGAASSV